MQVRDSCAQWSTSDCSGRQSDPPIRHVYGGLLESVLDRLRSGLVSVHAAYSASESFAAGCAIASNALSDYLLPELPLCYRVEIQAALTWTVSAVAVTAPMTMD